MPLVAIEYIAPKIRNKEICVPVIIEIARRNPHAITRIRHPPRFANLDKTPALVPVELVLWCIRRNITRQIPAIYDIQVHPPIPVIIKKCRARPNRLHRVFAPRHSARMHKVDPRLRRRVDKAHLRLRRCNLFSLSTTLGGKHFTFITVLYFLHLLIQRYITTRKLPETGNKKAKFLARSTKQCLRFKNNRTHLFSRYLTIAANGIHLFIRN